MQRSSETTQTSTPGRSPEFDLSNPASSYLSTLRAVILSPRRYFLGFETEGSLREPAVYAFLVGVTGGIISLVVAPVFSFFFASEANATWGVSFGLPPLEALGFAVLSPAFVAVMAAVYLLAVRTFVGKVGDFRQMYRMAAYAYSAMALAWIPLIGAFAITYALMVTMGVGVRFVYRTTFLTALISALSSFLPLALILTALYSLAFQSLSP